MKNQTEELRSIQRLRDADVVASKAYDAEGLAALFTDDAVALGPGQPPVRGIDAIRAGLRRMVASLDIEVLDYSEVFEETLLFGDTAVYGAVSEHRGSISAEHGIGSLKKDFLHLSRSPEEVALMWATAPPRMPFSPTSSP